MIFFFIKMLEILVCRALGNIWVDVYAHCLYRGYDVTAAHICQNLENYIH